MIFYIDIEKNWKSYIENIEWFFYIIDNLIPTIFSIFDFNDFTNISIYVVKTTILKGIFKR